MASKAAHYRMAEQLIEDLLTRDPDLLSTRTTLPTIALAQVHATLATVGDEVEAEATLGMEKAYDGLNEAHQERFGSPGAHWGEKQF